MKFFYSLLVLLIVLANNSFAQRPQLTLSTIQRPPISTTEQTGLADQIAIQAFARAGIELIIEPMQAKRAIVNANNGIHDGDLARVGATAINHPNLIPIPEITWIAEIQAFGNPSLSGQYFNWENLKHYQKSYIRGWVIFENNIPPDSLTHPVSSPESLFKMLDSKRTELVLYEKKMGLHIIKSMQLSNIQALDPSLSISPIYIFLHNKHRKLIPKINQALKAMKQDGSYRRIIHNSLKSILNHQQIEAYIERLELTPSAFTTPTQ